MKYRKKPVVIEAIQWTGDNAREVVTFCGYGLKYDPDRRVLFIPTLEGTHEASAGDWIICGVKGEHYPCKPDIFAATYEPVAFPAESEHGAARAPGIKVKP